MYLFTFPFLVEPGISGAPRSGERARCVRNYHVKKIRQPVLQWSRLFSPLSGWPERAHPTPSPRSGLSGNVFLKERALRKHTLSKCLGEHDLCEVRCDLRVRSAFKITMVNLYSGPIDLVAKMRKLGRARKFYVCEHKSLWHLWGNNNTLRHHIKIICYLVQWLDTGVVQNNG